MTRMESPLDLNRSQIWAGFDWTMNDIDDLWAINVKVLAPIHKDGLLEVEYAIDAVRLALQFAIDPKQGDPVEE